MPRDLHVMIDNRMKRRGLTIVGSFSPGVMEPAGKTFAQGTIVIFLDR